MESYAIWETHFPYCSLEINISISEQVSFWATPLHYHHKCADGALDPIKAELTLIGLIFKAFQTDSIIGKLAIMSDMNYNVFLLQYYCT